MIAHTKVIDVLKALPRVGAVRAGQVMERLDIAANRRLRGLGQHQIAALVAEFSARASGRVRPDVTAVATAGARLTVVSGPTAVGKGTVVARLAAEHPEMFVSVSATTRPPRPGEVDGVHYHFVSDGRVRRADRRRTRCWSGPSCTACTATAPRGRRSWPRSPRAGPPCWRSTCRAPGRSGQLAEAHVRLPGPAVVGGAGASAGRPGHRDRREQRDPPAGHRRAELAARPSSTTWSSTAM